MRSSSPRASATRSAPWWRPTLAYGMSQHHLGFAGSVTLRPSTMIAMVGDIVHSLVRHGFERFFFINGHGGNIATVTAAFDEIYADLSMRQDGKPSPVRCRMLMWFGARCARDLERALSRRRRLACDGRRGLAVAILP